MYELCDAVVFLKQFNGPLARKQKYCRNVGDVTSGGASATVLCTEKIGETGVLFVGCSRVLESCSLPRICEQGENVLVLTLGNGVRNVRIGRSASEIEEDSL